jgi:hypothetical protein
MQVIHGFLVDTFALTTTEDVDLEWYFTAISFYSKKENILLFVKRSSFLSKKSYFYLVVNLTLRVRDSIILSTKFFDDSS